MALHKFIGITIFGMTLALAILADVVDAARISEIGDDHCIQTCLEHNRDKCNLALQLEFVCLNILDSSIEKCEYETCWPQCFADFFTNPKYLKGMNCQCHEDCEILVNNEIN